MSVFPPRTLTELVPSRGGASRVAGGLVAVLLSRRRRSVASILPGGHILGLLLLGLLVLVGLVLLLLLTPAGLVGFLRGLRSRHDRSHLGRRLALVAHEPVEPLGAVGQRPSQLGADVAAETIDLGLEVRRHLLRGGAVAVPDAMRDLVQVRAQRAGRGARELGVVAGAAAGG